MSANWVSRTYGRTRPGSSAEALFQPVVAGDHRNPLGLLGVAPKQIPAKQPVSSRRQTTVSARGVNGTKKTVITIRRLTPTKPATKVTKPAKVEPKVEPKVVPKMSPKLEFKKPQEEIVMPVASPQRGPLRRTVAPKASAKEYAPDEFNFGFSLPSSPASTLTIACPPLRKSDSPSQSLENSIETVIVDDGLSCWGLPRILEDSVEDSVEEEFSEYQTTPESEIDCYFGTLPSKMSVERQQKAKALLYMLHTVKAYKQKKVQKQKFEKEEALRVQQREQLRVQLEREQRERKKKCFDIPLFGFWM